MSSREVSETIATAKRFIRAAGRRVGEEGDEPELRELLALQDVLSDAIGAAVAGQRQRGASWATIALGTGKTRQAAQLRWGGDERTTS